MHLSLVPPVIWGLISSQEASTSLPPLSSHIMTWMREWVQLKKYNHRKNWYVAYDTTAQ